MNHGQANNKENTMATQLQLSMILSIQDFAIEYDYFAVWQSLVIRTSQDKGVFTSLIMAGLIGNQGSGNDAVCWLTDSGKQLVEQHKESAA